MKRKSNCKESDAPNIKEIAKTNVLKRGLLSVIMISSFSFLISLDSFYLAIFVIVLGFLVNREIISISKNTCYPCNILIVNGLSILIYVYYVVDSLVFCLPSIARIIPYVHNIYFYAYISLFMLFVCGLTKGKLRSQFAVYALIHLSSYFCAIASRSGVRNIAHGKFWLVFPSSLVICNDIMAYVVGKSLGKTPLYKLSPKKTVEGFIGGFLGTAVFGFIFCYFHLQSKVLSNTYSQEISQTYKFTLYDVPFGIKKLYLHCVPLVLIASFIAPFSGFLASALKRAYKKKDFGQSIPGHGGVADRFDCQIIMVLFTSLYIKTFLKTKEQSLFSTFTYITRNLTVNEIEILQRLLKRFLKAQQA